MKYSFRNDQSVRCGETGVERFYCELYANKVLDENGYIFTPSDDFKQSIVEAANSGDENAMPFMVLITNP